jgi:hypothetical protein
LQVTLDAVYLPTMKKRKDPRKVLAAKVRAFKLSPKRRRAIALKAIRARWRKHPKGSKARSAAGLKAWATRRASPDYMRFRTLEATESHRDRMTRRKQRRSMGGLKKKEGSDL